MSTGSTTPPAETFVQKVEGDISSVINTAETDVKTVAQDVATEAKTIIGQGQADMTAFASFVNSQLATDLVAIASHVTVWDAEAVTLLANVGPELALLQPILAAQGIVLPTSATVNEMLGQITTYAVLLKNLLQPVPATPASTAAASVAAVVAPATKPAS